MPRSVVVVVIVVVACDRQEGRGGMEWSRMGWDVSASEDGLIRLLKKRVR